MEATGSATMSHHVTQNQPLTSSDDKQNEASAPSMFPPDPPSYPSSLPPPYWTTEPVPPSSMAQGMPYHQHYSPSAIGQPYFPPTTTVYPGQEPPPPSYYQHFQPQQPQQQQVVVVGIRPNPVAIVVPRVSSVSFTGAIVLSCIVYWFFGWIFGGIAFIVAMIGQSTAAEGDIQGAIRLRNASIGLSTVGIAVAIAVIIIIAVVCSQTARRYSSNDYYYSTYQYKQCWDSARYYYYACKK